MLASAIALFGYIEVLRSMSVIGPILGEDVGRLLSVSVATICSPIDDFSVSLGNVIGGGSFGGVQVVCQVSSWPRGLVPMC